VKEINEKKRDVEREAKIMEITKSLTFANHEDIQLMKEKRELLESFQFNVIFKKQNFKSQMFLFNDLLLLTKSQKGHFLYKTAYPLSHVLVCDLENKDDAKYRTKFPFCVELRSGDTLVKDSRIIFFTNSAPEKKKWVDLLRDRCLKELLLSPDESPPFPSSKSAPQQHS